MSESNVLRLLLDFLLVRVLYRVNNGRFGELEEIFVEEFLRERFGHVVGVERGHVWWRVLPRDRLVLTEAEDCVVDACKAVHWTWTAVAMHVQHVVFGVDSPNLRTATTTL